MSVAGAAGVADAAPQVGASATAGETAHEMVTLPVKPFVDVTLIVEVAEPPGLTEAGERAVAASEKVEPVGDCENFATKASVPPPPSGCVTPAVVGKSVADVVLPDT